MKNRSVVFLGLCTLVGCNLDRRVDVRLSLPDGTADAISIVRIQVLEPPRANPFDCDDLAFSDVEASAVELSIVEEARVQLGEKAELLDLSRSAQKLYYAVAFDEGGRRVLAACSDVGDVQEDLVIDLDAEPIAEVRVTERSPLSGRLGDASTQSPELGVFVTDVRGQPLGGVDTRWNVVAGSGESSSSGADRTFADGTLLIRPERPNIPGPFVVDVQVRWADPTLSQGVVVPVSIDGVTDGGFEQTLESRLGRVGPFGEPGVAVLVRQGDGVKIVTIYYAGSPAELAMVTSELITGVFADPSPKVYAFGFLEDTRGVRDRVLLVSQRLETWNELTPDGNSFKTRPFAPPSMSGRELRSVLPAGECEADGSRLLVEFSDKTFQLFDENGNSQSELFSLEFDPLDPSEQFVASGCLSDEQGAVRRTFVYDPSFFGLIFVAPAGVDEFFVGQWSAVADGLAFTGPIGGQRSVLGTQISLDDLVVTRGILQLVPGDTTTFLNLVPVVVDRMSGFPSSLSGGDLDADGRLDLVAFVDLSTTVDETRFGVQIVLGAEYRSSRIGGSIALTASGRERVHVADFDVDGVDDIFIVDVAPDRVSVQLYPMGASR